AARRSLYSPRARVRALPPQSRVDSPPLPPTFYADEPSRRPEAPFGQDLRLPAQLHLNDGAGLLQSRTRERRGCQFRQTGKFGWIEVEQVLLDAPGEQGRLRRT